MQEFSTLLEHVTLHAGHILIAGDLNFHVDVESDRDASIFRDIFDTAGLKQLVVDPTHQNGHTLDLLLTRILDDSILQVSLSHHLPSDHAAVTCQINIGRPSPVKVDVQVRKLWDIDIEALRGDI